MKRGFLFSLLIIFALCNLTSQEAQISFGSDVGFGIFKIDRDNIYDQTSSGLIIIPPGSRAIRENSTTGFFAPGISFNVRRFDFDGKISQGIFLHFRTAFITNSKTTGTRKESISVSHSIEGEPLTGIMDLDFGLSTRFTITDRSQFYVDLGVNFTIMGSDYSYFSIGSYKPEMDYWGFGLYSGLALQVNLTNTMFLEFGINAIVNIFSGQEISSGPSYQRDKYEDTGRWDWAFVGTGIKIGWRIDLAKSWGLRTTAQSASGAALVALNE